MSQLAATSSPPAQAASREDLLSRARLLADQLAASTDHVDATFMRDALRRLHELGLLTASLPAAHGGAGLGTEPGGHLPLLQILCALGGGDLSLARLFEGHTNALILLAAYGTPDQLVRAAADAHAGLLFGVWNTGHPELLRLEDSGGQLTLLGGKTFCSGAGVVQRPIITAELPGGGWQMLLLRADAPEVAASLQIDTSSWQPLGMEASGSFTVDFTGAFIAAFDLIGAPGDFYRDPLFRGGAIRFAAAHAGAILRLFRSFAEWLDSSHRDADPYQIHRLGELALLAEAAVLWTERAATSAESGLYLHVDKFAAERIVELAGRMRIAVEHGATAAMAILIPGIGARGLLHANNFERVIRDLTMYLRQPAPDATLAEVGRSAIRRLRLGSDLTPWSDDAGASSLTPAYFDSVYRNATDPWNFETSAYEAGKYATTLAALPHGHFRSALEVGCSIGVLTQQLAAHCDRLLAVDVSDRALARARERCAHLTNVSFAQLQIPRQMPPGEFDLILLSEVAYYWQREELEQAATLLAARQHPGDTLLLVHLHKFVPDYPLTGDQVHAAFLARPEWRVTHSERHERYRLDVLERTDLSHTTP